MTTQVLSIALPADYRSADVLAFHARDAEGLAEQVDGARLRKAVLLGGVPVLFDVALAPKTAECRMTADGPLGTATQALAEEALRNILALRIDPAPFADFVRDDPLFAPLVARQPGLRIVQSATVFEALTWAIIGQQINLPFAISLRRTFIEQAGRAHSSGLWCYPEAQDVARLELDTLTSRKFSRAKAETLLRVARMADAGELDLAQDDDPARTAQALLAIKGIGPWTVNYTLLRGYGYADCSLEGDVAVRGALGRLLGETEKPGLARTQAWLAQYSPHRTMAAAYLWASLSQTAG
ncbi:DNA-3-methyladenine glycosylase [Massilia sp. Mn16-1_5]|uniref:DNA-3-methyladenine glycosylase family protein n=1 Tax=Massilia sp. Mn16-1_5 TaxID=2079199 RepID=UPI00109EABBA|nr:AlkA N-terminal domain-containing protein [Massilia sp. Mn16-1_5]THC45862.1 DNA repair protein [Massilia sp. Mn16-1_5]